MKHIPWHQAVFQTRNGINIKEVSPEAGPPLVAYTHRDDYYVFGVVTQGACRASIDFTEREIRKGEVVCVFPGQVHVLTEPRDAHAFLLFVDSTFVETDFASLFSEYALCPFPVFLDEAAFQDLVRLLTILLHRMDSVENGSSENISVVRNLSGAVIGIIGEAIRAVMGQTTRNRRHVEIMMAFRKLLSASEDVNREIVHYAEQLHLSPVYLNEVVREVTGVSVGRYLQNELLLRARRMLIHTTLTVREIAFRLGVDDPAYFTRMFVRVVGMSPTAFRRKYLG